MNYSLLFHGFISFLIGNFAGIIYSKSIKKLVSNETGWKLLHTASVMGGIMLMVFSIFFNCLTKDFQYKSYFFYCILLSNYIFILGMILAAFTSKRGVDKKENGWSNKIIYIFYYIAASLSFIYTFVFIFLVLKTN